MDEKRMVGDYTVINSMYIGHKEIIQGENPKAVNGERYVCCYAERVLFYEQYLTGDEKNMAQPNGARLAQSTRNMPTRIRQRTRFSRRMSQSGLTVESTEET